MPHYHVAKHSPEPSHNFRNISARTSYFLIFFYFVRRDRKAYANNPSYRFTVVDEELTEF